LRGKHADQSLTLLTIRNGLARVFLLVFSMLFIMFLFGIGTVMMVWAVLHYNSR
jgi:hypothetical protein